MKASRVTPEVQFVPIVITIETQAELDAIRAIGNECTDLTGIERAVKSGISSNKMVISLVGSFLYNLAFT